MKTIRLIISVLLIQIPILTFAQNSDSDIYEEAKLVFEGLNVEDIKEDVMGRWVFTKTVDPKDKERVLAWKFENKSEFIDTKIISNSMYRKVNPSLIIWNVEVSFLLKDSDGKWLIENAILRYDYSSKEKKSLKRINAEKMEKTELEAF